MMRAVLLAAAHRCDRQPPAAFKKKNYSAVVSSDAGCVYARVSDL